MEPKIEELHATLRDVIHRTNNHLGGTVSLAEVLEGLAVDEGTRRIAQSILRSCEDLRTYLQGVRQALMDEERHHS